jgi:hypothetical protein
MDTDSKEYNNFLYWLQRHNDFKVAIDGLLKNDLSFMETPGHRMGHLRRAYEGMRVAQVAMARYKVSLLKRK